MITSQTTILSEVLQAERISDATFAYFQERLQNEIHNVIVTEFARLETTGRMSRAGLARRMGCAPELITRWLGVGSNYTARTISRLVTAMRGQLKIEFLPLQEASAVRPTEEDSALLSVIQAMTTSAQPSGSPPKVGQMLKAPVQPGKQAA